MAIFVEGMVKVNNFANKLAFIYTHLLVPIE